MNNYYYLNTGVEGTERRTLSEEYPEMTPHYEKSIVKVIQIYEKWYRKF